MKTPSLQQPHLLMNTHPLDPVCLTSPTHIASQKPSRTCTAVLAEGALTVGLVRQCQTIHGRDRTCIPPRLPPEWVTTLFFIIMGIISLTVTCGLLVASHWRREATKYARWIAFTGMILFCMAALIFPIGFYINEVGGQPYKLPNNTVVGSSYVLFVLSIFFTIVGLLFAGKVCLPG
ncbi:modulator of smoothened protein [Tupaia chinensis]|uniref:modulator of smoothened protein n=1 Tax=Tupaia chinensis TaxID=246437 RepID=UPI0003C8D9D2|nr:modulator of smoothened protein [Tupaia chinensis]